MNKVSPTYASSPHVPQSSSASPSVPPQNGHHVHGDPPLPIPKL